MLFWLPTTLWFPKLNINSIHIPPNEWAAFTRIDLLCEADGALNLSLVRGCGKYSRTNSGEIEKVHPETVKQHCAPAESLAADRTAEEIRALKDDISSEFDLSEGTT